MNQKNDNDLARRSPLSYELIVRNGQAPQKDGAPHLILRRPAEDSAPLKIVDAAKASEVPASEDVLEELEESAVEAADIASANSVADYISSLNNHVSDDVARVVDAIIAEEGKLPSNLPKLDDKLTLIFPGSDVQDNGVDDLFYEKKDVETDESKSANYTKKVEYEDL